MDLLTAAYKNVSANHIDWYKQTFGTTAVAGQWYDLSMAQGTPSINAIIGTSANLAHQAITDTTAPTAATAATSGNITTTVFTDTTHGSGRFTVGMILSGTGVTPGTQITALGTGTGANSSGTYTISPSNPTVTSQTITGTAYANGIPHGGAVSTNVKHLMSAQVSSAAATTPGVFLIYDMLAQYTITTTTTTGAQNFSGQTAWPRYANGVGVQAFLVPSIIMGAGTPTVQLSYTNTASTAGQLTPSAPSLPVINTTTNVGGIPYSGTNVGKYGPFLPLATGDLGIKSVQNINFSATMTSGVMCLVICKPLALMTFNTVGVAVEKNFLNMHPSMPIINDGAVLSMLYHPVGNTPLASTFTGFIETIWG